MRDRRNPGRVAPGVSGPNLDLRGVRWSSHSRERVLTSPKPLIPYVLVRAARPGHDGPGAHNAEYRRLAPRSATFPCRGARGHKAGRPARITPRDLCRVV